MRIALRFLVVVMLLTVLSPKFGWESASASAAEAHVLAAGLVHDEAPGHEAQGDCHEHDAPMNDDTGDHHCCPGHVLGHLFGGVAATPGLPPASKDSALPSSRSAHFSSRIPDGLERPPRVAA